MEVDYEIIIHQDIRSSFYGGWEMKSQRKEVDIRNLQSKLK